MHSFMYVPLLQFNWTLPWTSSIWTGSLDCTSSVWISILIPTWPTQLLSQSLLNFDHDSDSDVKLWLHYYFNKSLSISTSSSTWLSCTSFLLTPPYSNLISTPHKLRWRKDLGGTAHKLKLNCLSTLLRPDLVTTLLVKIFSTLWHDIHNSIFELKTLILLLWQP